MTNRYYHNHGGCKRCSEIASNLGLVNERTMALENAVDTFLGTAADRGPHNPDRAKLRLAVDQSREARKEHA